MDDATARRTRISYARICVVVDIEFKFPSFILSKIGEGDIVDIGLDYEWVPDLCTSCKIFGHFDSKCIKNKEVSENPVIQPQMARTQVQNKPRKQHMRWTPKKNTLTGQTSCLRDKNGTTVTNDGQTEDTPVIITEEVGQTQERTYREVTEALEPTVRGSQVVVHSEVQASNRFAVLMPAEDEGVQESETEIEKQNNMEIVPYVAAISRNEQELLQEDKFEEVRTEFEPSEVGPLNTEGEEGNSEDSKEKKVYSIKRGEIRQEDSYSVSEEEFEKAYFSDHLDAEEDSEVAGMLESPPINGISVKTKQLIETTGLSSQTGWHKAKRKSRNKAKGETKVRKDNNEEKEENAIGESINAIASTQHMPEFSAFNPFLLDSSILIPLQVWIPLTAFSLRFVLTNRCSGVRAKLGIETSITEICFMPPR
ncbi:hypothetical protein IFM89_001081 [Coptis chinensis]|uniref:Zinc knuckle CX2CX4HX4C domain-containing protein n=1 Tax=Coptis chinensis TaxID=261450 RepID=A0A835HFE2_9MAGN|nr:hypothetical protein IFM89_001081 [Coptis chinensis]